MSTDANPHDDPEVVVCAGPPECPFTGDDAVTAAQAGCPNCNHIVVRPDGSETTYKLRPS